MVLQVCPQGDDDGHKRRQTSLQAPWRADADERPHQEGEVEAADVHEEPFQDVRVAAQMDAPHATGFVEMRVRSFQPLATAPVQRPPTYAADTPPVRVHRGARRRLRRPGPPPTIGLGTSPPCQTRMRLGETSGRRANPLRLSPPRCSCATSRVNSMLSLRCRAMGLPPDIPIACQSFHPKPSTSRGALHPLTCPQSWGSKTRAE